MVGRIAHAPPRRPVEFKPKPIIHGRSTSPESATVIVAPPAPLTPESGNQTYGNQAYNVLHHRSGRQPSHLDPISVQSLSDKRDHTGEHTATNQWGSTKHAWEGGVPSMHGKGGEYQA